MYKSFQNFKEQREIQDFNNKLEIVCESIAKSGVNFDFYWRNHGLPVMLESYKFESSEELLNELNAPSWLGGRGEAIDQMSQMQSQQPMVPQPEEAPSREEQAKKIAAPIRQAFLKAIFDFKNSIQGTQFTRENPSAWKAAEILAKQASAWATNWMPKLKPEPLPTNQPMQDMGMSRPYPSTTNQPAPQPMPIGQ